MGSGLAFRVTICHRFAALLESGVGLISGFTAIQRPQARVLGCQRGDDDQRFGKCASTSGFNEHSRQARVNRQPRHLAADGRELIVIDGLQFMQQAAGVADGAGMRRIDEGKAVDAAQPKRPHRQHHGSQVGALDFGIGIAWTGGKVVLAVEPKADARRDAPATPGALGGAGLGDGFHRQPLQLGAIAVAADAGEAGVNHIADVRHGDAGFGDIGGQDHALSASGREHALLLAVWQTGI